MGKVLRMVCHFSEDRRNGGISVSGYILAPPGRGLIGVVVPSSGEPFLTTTFRTSFGILSND